MTKALRPGVVFDRDGVLNVDTGYVFRPEELVWIDGARDLIVRLNRAGVVVVVATNQSGVGRGLFSEAELAGFHAEMQSQLGRLGGRIDHFYHCPYHEDATLEAFRVAGHPDRKPNPGMVLRAIADWNLDPSRSLMIGDRQGDVEAGRAAGLSALLFMGEGLEAMVVEGLSKLGVEV